MSSGNVFWRFAVEIGSQQRFALSKLPLSSEWIDLMWLMNSVNCYQNSCRIFPARIWDSPFFARKQIHRPQLKSITCAEAPKLNNRSFNQPNIQTASPQRNVITENCTSARTASSTSSSSLSLIVKCSIATFYMLKFWNREEQIRSPLFISLSSCKRGAHKTATYCDISAYEYVWCVAHGMRPRILLTQMRSLATLYTSIGIWMVLLV